ncbi:MAG: glycosyltransferase family 39 protein [Anaerolineae bacterium]|nr:glycosyltransferase family 39 protein [Anaerolineae bacterium]
MDGLLADLLARPPSGTGRSIDRQPFQSSHLPIILALLSILLLAAALRFHRIDAQSLWNDEGTSVVVAGRDLATITRAAAADIHPPLYYWLLSGWVRLAGTTELAVRALSALTGILLVALTYPLGRLLAGRWAGVAAAALAAIHPFQVYYSQEARMYILLALWAALAFYAALRWLTAGRDERAWPWGLLYAVSAAAGLYTHYAFPFVLAAINLLVLFDWLLRWAVPGRGWAGRGQWQRLVAWLAFQAGALLLFAPWLPVAYRQLTTWPRLATPVGFIPALTHLCQLFTTGPAASPWTETSYALLLFLLLYVPYRARHLAPDVAYAVPIVWLGLPVVAILALGLYREAYLKFLIVASPAFCLLAARFATGPLHEEWGGARRGGQVVLYIFFTLLLVTASVHGLGDYYTDPAYARDDYRAIVEYVDAVGWPGDAIVLNAEGQQEVFGYYYDGDLPVLPLPAQRPLDPASTQATLESLAQPGGRVYAVLWGTDESDPERFVEGWLDTHAYKASDSWYGNVRLVVYAVPDETPDTPAHKLGVTLADPQRGDEITLHGYSVLNDQLASGDIAQVTLFWETKRSLDRRYKVFLHVLDRHDQIVGQRDAEPGGGALLTTLWVPGEVIQDNYGVPIHPATPPGDYRVEVGLYDAETGQRLVTPDGASQVWLDPLTVERPAAPAPVAALGLEEMAGVGWGSLTLLGYDLHELGFDHQPDAPLSPGDVLHVNLYWRAEEVPGGDWLVTITMVDNEDERRLTGVEGQPVVGYPTSLWQVGDVWRGQFNLPIPAHLPPGRYPLRIQPHAPGVALDPFLTEPFTLE